jgi:hypothetical protein
MNEDQHSIIWEAPEYHHVPKSSDWFWAVGIISASIVLLTFIYGNILLGILIIVGTFGIFMHANKEPMMREIELNEKGVRIGKRFYPYKTLESFWLEVHEVEHDEFGNLIFAKLLIKSRKTLMPLIVIPVEYPDLDEIREFLMIFLIEEEHHEPLAQKLIEYFGF